MKAQMTTDMKSEEQVDYNSKHGLALLYQKCGGILSETMEDAIRVVRIFIHHS